MTWTRWAASAFCAVFAAVAVPSASAGPSRESCFVSIVRLKDAPVEEYPDGMVYVQIYIGATRLFETPDKPLTAPGFTNRITFSTAKSMPIRLVVRIRTGGDGVVAEQAGRAGLSKSANPPPPANHRKDRARLESVDGEDVLGEGFEGLIGDYDILETSPAASDPPAYGVAGTRKTRPGDRGVGTVSKSRGVVLCDVSLEWPPSDGIHSLACGTSALEIRTEMVRR